MLPRAFGPALLGCHSGGRSVRRTDIENRARWPARRDALAYPVHNEGRAIPRRHAEPSSRPWTAPRKGGSTGTYCRAPLYMAAAWFSLIHEKVIHHRRLWFHLIQLTFSSKASVR